MRRLALLVLLSVLALPGGLRAQAPVPPLLSDEQVTRLLMLALDNIHKAQCRETQPCAPTTAEEKAKPPITPAEAHWVIQRGALTGAAMHCGLDWQKRNFAPMMAYWREKARKNDRQIALISLLHGIVQGITQPNASAPPHCPEDVRRGVEARLTFNP